MDISFLDAKGIDTRTGIEFTGNKEKYISTLKRYFNGFEDNSKKVCELYEKGDMDNYSITVHALKSNSKMVGAMALAELFPGYIAGSAVIGKIYQGIPKWSRNSA